MNESVLILLRFGGYVLNIFLFMAVILRYRHHAALLGWVALLIVSAAASLLRYAGLAESYFVTLDYGLTPLLYINAFLIVWMLVKYEAPRR